MTTLRTTTLRMGSAALAAAMAMTLVAPALAQDDADPQPGGRTIAIPNPTAGLPPADRPLPVTHVTPVLSFDGGAGVLGYIAGAATLGPAWNARVTAYLTDRFAVEGNYTGSANRRSDQTGTLVYTAIDAGLRYNILRADQAPVQPYLAGGIGYVGYAGPGGDMLALTLPISVGAERLITERIKAGARFNLRPALLEDLSHPNQRSNAPATGGDTWTLIANLGGTF
jgi:hypothetical protein